MLSRTSLDRLLNKIDSSGVSKDGKIEAAVHGLLEQQQTLCIEAWRKVSQASGISE